MKFTTYLKDKLSFLIFYAALMAFILMTVWLDRRNRILTSNIGYILFMSFIMMTVYLMYDYLTKNVYIKKLTQYKGSNDKTPILPKPIEYKDTVYSEVINDLYNSYDKSIKNIQDKVAEDKDFMTAWVHEIKTPITTLRLLVDNADVNNINCNCNDGCSDVNSMDFISSSKEEIDKIDGYVEKVLYYSRSDSFSRDYMISEVLLDSIVKESVKKHSIIFIRKHIKFIDNIDSEMRVDTDRKWLLFIINQLISNALKYTAQQPPAPAQPVMEAVSASSGQAAGPAHILEPKHQSISDTTEILHSPSSAPKAAAPVYEPVSAPSVTVSTDENDKEKILIIQDNGSGIKKEDMQRLFTKAFTGNNGRAFNSKSTGMGLYLSQKLAEKLNHYITIESVYKQGTKVYVHFPKW